MLATARPLILIGVILGGSAAWTRELTVPQHPKTVRVWQWAAAVAMVASYAKGFTISECQVLAAYNRLIGERETCCEEPLGCMRPGEPQETSFVLESIYGIGGHHLPRPLTITEVRGEIDRGKPVIAYLGDDTIAHRVVVITGYEGTEAVTLIDPDVGKKRVPYALLLQDPGLGGWRDSVTFSDPVSQAQPHAAPIEDSGPSRAMPSSESRATVVPSDPASASAQPARPPIGPTTPWLLFPQVPPCCSEGSWTPAP